jgi:DNA polymerase III subunit delta
LTDAADSAAGGRRLKPAYLIHGDEHGAIAERRAGLRALAESQDAACLEVLEGDAATPAGVAQALSAMTLTSDGGLGRVIIVDGVERWRDGDVEKHLLAAMREMPPATTLALFAREESRVKAPATLHRAVASAGGQVVEQASVKPWELAKWVRERASREGLELDSGASKALVEHVGERPQRLARELEKLALELDAGAPQQVDAEHIGARAARSSESRGYALADAIVAGDRLAATRLYLRLRQQGERLSGLGYLIAGRLRDALAISLRLRQGEPASQIKRGLRMPSRAADRLIADAQRSDPERLRAALEALAQLELDSRGGALVTSSRTALAALGEDTLAIRAIEAMTER